MAKKKSDDGAADDIQPLDQSEAGEAGDTPHDELAAARAEIEALKAKLAARDAAADLGTLPDEIDPSWPVFLVQSQHAPSWVVQAPNVGLAPEAWRRATGVINTPYPIEVQPAPGLKPGRHVEG